MAGDNSVGSGHAHDEAQGMEVLRANLLTQETALTALVNSVDRRFQTYERCFDEIAGQLDALTIGANRNRINGRWLAQGQPINRHVSTRHRRQPVYNNNSEEEDFLFRNQ